ncbi:glycoside hydrolase family 15 [Candidatus Woesearchaeota archaeon]|nr:MAG: glycoside hydrolase family 15 [Candidatus Woesearchaeota archaeon]
MLKTIKQHKYKNGLFKAANSDKTGYNRVWIRDVIYTVLGFEANNDLQTSCRAVQSLMDILKKHEYKIDWMIRQPHPKLRYRYIHPRYDPNGEEITHQEWGNKQNDAIGALLWKIGDLDKKGIKILRGESDIRLVQKLVKYLEAIEYWHDEDNGMWEENEEVHASSVGACLAGLVAVQHIVKVPLHLIAHGEQTLRHMLPRESATKETDLALLSLIWPYRIVTKKERDAILKNVEEKLVREKGVARYLKDQYYSNGNEAEWTMGLAWLSIIHKQIGNNKKSAHYLEKTRSASNSQGHLPELYYGKTTTHNENTPLLWAMSLWSVAEKLNEK